MTLAQASKRICVWFFPFCLLLTSFASGQNEPESWREVFARLIVAEDDEEDQLVEQLSQFGDPGIASLYEAWRTGDVYELVRNDQKLVLRQLEDESWIVVATGAPETLSSEEIESASKLRASRGLRRTMKSLIDTLGLKADDPLVRRESAKKLGLSQDDEFLPALRDRLEIESDPEVVNGLKEGIAISLLKNGSEEEILESVIMLGSIKSIPGRDFVQKILDAEVEAGEETSALALACTETIKTIESYTARLEFFGNFARGLSLGSVLLIVSIGLAITFGLMGIINMAHGEFVAIGGYTAYVVQNFFISVWGIDSAAFGWYFVVSIPASFVVAALIGSLTLPL